MRIGILTYHRSHNYGAFLQAYALSHSLQQQFPESIVEIIDYDTKASHKEYISRIIKVGRISGIVYYAKQYNMFMKQLSKLKLSDKSLITDDYELFKKTYESNYDLIVVGSDQVWVTTGMRGFPNTFWLPGDYKPIKISYAASSRSEMSKMPLYQQELLHDYLNDFRYVGARDDATISEVNKFLENGKTARFNPDPVFTWNFGDHRERGFQILKDKFGVKDGDKTLGVMLAKKENAAIAIEKANSLGYIPIPLYIRHKNAKNTVLDPFEWFSVISALDGMITSYFHGMCFSLIYNTPFVVLEERKTTPDRSKTHDLLNRIGYEDNYIGRDGNVGDAIESIIVDKTADYSKACQDLYDRFLFSVKEIKESIS